MQTMKQESDYPNTRSRSAKPRTRQPYATVGDSVEKSKDNLTTVVSSDFDIAAERITALKDESIKPLERLHEAIPMLIDQFNGDLDLLKEV